MKDCIVSCNIEDNDVLNTSDHFPVSTVLSIHNLRPLLCELKPCPNIKWGKIDKNILREYYTDPCDSECVLIYERISEAIATPQIIDDSFEALINTMIRASGNLPKPKWKRHYRPYWNGELKQLKAEKIKWWRLWKENGRPRQPQNEHFIKYKVSKLKFKKRLKELHRQYETEEIADIIKTSEVNRAYFWRRLKSIRGNRATLINAIKGEDGVTRHNPEDILDVWHKHFAKLSKPKNLPEYDNDHFNYVNNFVDDTLNNINGDAFTGESITNEEVALAIKKLKKGKTPGHDNVTSEHIQHAGVNIIVLLTLLFNMCIKVEHVPKTFKVGIQVPLFKGKNTCSLLPTNYRGITLLSSLSKLFEIIIWARIEPWWVENRVISENQGACVKKRSCLHSAFCLQEAIATSGEDTAKCFVAFFDVAKAFDTIWINGLFYQLYNLGITGKLWRIMRQTYVNFECKVRIATNLSQSCVMDCGIHQGGILSLLKYVAFTNSLLNQITDSRLCITIKGIKAMPVGYADDLSTACISKDRLDRVLQIVYGHSVKWRYQYNAEKSAILTYGEGKREQETNSKHRVFNLGGKKIPEKTNYEHVGVKVYIHMMMTTRS